MLSTGILNDISISGELVKANKAESSVCSEKLTLVFEANLIDAKVGRVYEKTRTVGLHLSVPEKSVETI